MKLDLLVEVSQVDLEKTKRLNFGCLSWLTSPSLVCLKHILSILSSQNHEIELTALNGFDNNSSRPQRTCQIRK